MNAIIKNLISEMVKMPIIDAHEHLPAESEIVNRAADVLTRIFCLYSVTIAESAGFDGDRAELKDTSIPLEERWRRFSPYLNAIRDSGYATAAIITARDLYGIEEINDDTYQELSERIQTANKPGLYDDILKKRCNIKKILNQGSWDDGAGGYAVSLFRGYMPAGEAGIEALLAKSSNNEKGFFLDPVEWIRSKHSELRDSGVVGIKFHANQFPNVNLNLAWCHQISPYMTEHMLNEWIDLVPLNKIIGFGGDNCFGPEKTYGVLRMAMENIARALAVRLKRGQISDSRALEICRMWLYGNPKRIYGI